MRNNLQRYLFAVLVLVCLQAPATCWAEAPWMIDFDKAKVAATEQNKHLLVNFSGSDWLSGGRLT